MIMRMWIVRLVERLFMMQMVQLPIDLVGNENTFVLDASSEFDFFGYSYDPLIPMILR